MFIQRGNQFLSSISEIWEFAATAKIDLIQDSNLTVL